ncbi:MAG: hypothetical protein ACOC78_03220, partial [Actinomycetota bacterium]
MEGSEVGYALTAGQIKESVLKLIAGVEAEDPRKLAAEIFGEDVEFSEALINAFPSLLGAGAQVIKGFAASMEGMPAERSVELLSNSVARIDGGELADAANSFLSMLIRLYEERPELLTEEKMGVVSEAAGALDFGKLRKALIYRIQASQGYLTDEVELLGNMPIAMINLFNILPPYLNRLIRVLDTVLQNLSLPPEATTYALLKIFQDLDWDEIGQAVNSASKVVNIIHRGNLVLGDGNPQSREVASRISEDLCNSLDWEGVAEALKSVGEEREVLVTSLVSTALDKEERVLPVLEALLSWINSSLRSYNNILDKAGGLSTGTMKQIGDRIENIFDARELGRLVDSLIQLSRKLASSNPELAGNLLKSVVSAVELDIGDRLGAEALGLAADRALASYMKVSREDPDRMARGLDDFLSGIDAERLEEAARSASRQLSEAVSRHPDLA